MGGTGNVADMHGLLVPQYTVYTTMYNLCYKQSMNGCNRSPSHINPRLPIGKRLS